MSRIFSTANWPFAVKFAVPCVMALLLVVVVEIAAIGALDTVRSSLDEIVMHKYNASVLLEKDIGDLRAVNGDVYLMQVKKAADLPEDINAETKHITDSLDHIADDLANFKVRYAAPDDADKIDKVLQNVRTYRKAVGFVGSMLDLDFKATVSFVLPLRGAYEDMIADLSLMANNFLSTSREDSFRADELARVRTQFITIFSVVILVITAVLMAGIVYSTARSIRGLSVATERLADGYTDINLEALARRDELGRMVKALTIFRDNIERVAALKKVSLLYASVNAMMDSLQQGLCSFGPDGICSDIYSKACIGLLEGSPAGRPIGDVLGVSLEENQTIKDVITMLFGENLLAPPSELLGMLPKRFHRKDDLSENPEDSSVSIEYRPILNSVGNVQSVLVIATDLSEELAAARAGRAREVEVLRTLRILSTRNQFIQFLNAMTDFFKDPEAAYSGNAEQLKRDIHTWKGTAAMYYLEEVAASLHELENGIGDAATPEETRSALRNSVASVHTAFLHSRQMAAKLLGDDFDRQGSVRTIALSRLEDFASKLRGTQGAQVVYNEFIHELMGEPVHKLLAGFAGELRELGERYGKQLLPCSFEGESFPILTEVYDPLFATFTHIARNIVAHAVDDPEARIEAGKDPSCAVMIETRRFMKDGQEWFRLVFSDDGRGINVAKLREKRASTLPDDQLMQTIFEDDVSSAAGITVLAGRGVGLSAVKVEAEHLGGSVHAESQWGRYTKITVEVPLMWDYENSRASVA